MQARRGQQVPRAVPRTKVSSTNFFVTLFCYDGSCLWIINICRYKSILINLRDEIEVRDMAHFFSLLYRGSIEECSGGLSAVARAAADGGRMKIRKGLDKEAYFAARRHPELREIVDMFSVSAACLGDAVRYGASLKVCISCFIIVTL